jgi:hypothetical protein
LGGVAGEADGKDKQLGGVKAAARKQAGPGRMGFYYS